MNAEIVFGTLLVVLLLALAGYFAWVEGRNLRRLRAAPAPADDEWRHLRNRAWRRLFCSLLMAVFAGLLCGALFVLEGDVQRLLAQGEAGDRPLGPEQQNFLNFYSVYWIAALLVLLGIIGTAAVDLWALRRYGLREHRKIQADRRAMIEREVAIYRQQRNGHHEN